MAMAHRSIALLACLVLLATACAPVSAASHGPNTVQVFEPTGKPDDWTFFPGEVSVARGTVVAFVNGGREFHTVTSDSPGRPFDLSINANQSGTITFDQVGTFSYHCGVHPQMKGVVRVCDGPCT
jgi:plastocyanin